jgi:hypothetical protein
MKKKYILLTSLFFAIGMAGCKKGFLSQEVNPNQPSVASPQNLLTGAEGATAQRLNGSQYNWISVWMGYTTPSGNYVPSPTLEQYSFTNTNFQVFNSIYANLANYQSIVTQAAANPSLNNFSAIAQIMSDLGYQELVDNYNDVPYSQALNSAKYLFPAYDPGQTVYNGIMSNLDAAIALINSSTSATNPGSSDAIFGGNMANWKKFANTLKLRIALRQSNLTANTAALKTEVQKTASEGYLDDNTFALCNPGYLNSDINSGQQSPFYLYYGYSAAGSEQGGHAYYRANNFYVGLLTNLGDTRLPQVFAPVPATGKVTGLTLGASNGALTNSVTSPYGPGIDQGPTMNATIIDGAQACFLLSEGVLSGYVTTGTAQDYYQRGITASFKAVGLTAAQAAAYYNQPGVANVNWAASSANYEQAIITQKYIALVGYGPFEAYNEYRRTGYPLLAANRSVKSGALGTGPVPSRIYYPSTEFSSNLSAVSAEPAINPFGTPLIFWQTTYYTR